MKRSSLPWVLLIIALVLLNGIHLPLGGRSDTFMVLRESTKDDLAFQEAVTELQDSESAVSKEIASHGWTVWVQDDDGVDGDNKPLDLLVKLKLHNTINDNKRFLVSLADDGTLVAKDELPPDATATTILDRIKAHGK